MKHVIYTPNGMFKFYWDNRLGICFYPPQNTTPLILFDKGQDDFDITCDEKGNLYLLCQDDKNNIYLYYYDRRQWVKQCVLESKSHVPYPKDFRIFCTNTMVHALYFIRHNSKYLLVHHILNDGNTPNVLESFDTLVPYTALCDSKQNLHIVYPKDAPVQKTFLWQTKMWQPARPLCDLEENLISLNAIFDKSDCLHITACIRQKMHFSVLYISENQKSRILSGLETGASPIILYHDGLRILFRMAGRLLQSVQENHAFSKPAYYFPGSFSPHSLFRMHTCKNLARHGIFANEIFGIEPRADRFSPTLIENTLRTIDFSLPEQPTEQDDLASYIEEVSDFKTDSQNDVCS